MPRTATPGGPGMTKAFSPPCWAGSATVPSPPFFVRPDRIAGMLQPSQFSLTFLFLEVLWLALFAGAVRVAVTLPAERGHFACVWMVVAITALGTFFGGMGRSMVAGAKAGYVAALILVLVGGLAWAMFS